MRTKRKIQIEKAIKFHSKKLLDTYFNNEHALACFGVSVISNKREYEICETLSTYAKMIERVFDEKDEIYEDELVKYIMDFY